MRKIILNGLTVMLLTVLFSGNILAQNKTIKKTINLPMFVADKLQIVDKPVDRDLMVAGEQVKVTNSVNGDAYVAGGQVEVSGNVNGNLIVGGGNVVINGKVAKNVIVGGGEVHLTETAEVGGYVLAGSGKMELSGKFAGPVKVGSGELTIGDKAVFASNLEADVSKANLATTAKINGEKKIQVHETKEPEVPKKQFKQLAPVGEVLAFLSKLLILLVIVKLVGKRLLFTEAKPSFWSLIGMGLVVLIVTPILAIMAMITVIAIPLSLITLVLYGVGLYISGILASVFIGNWLTEKGYIKTENLYAQGLIGLTLISLIGLIPVVGGVAKFIVLILGLGIGFKKIH